MIDSTAYAVDDLKTVYRVLHANLLDNIELMDSDFLTDLQRLLQREAGKDGVDVSDHGQWDAWLGQAHIPCAVRLDGRETLN